MKKSILLLSLILSISISSFAGNVDKTTAMLVAKNFYSSKANIMNNIDKEGLNLSLAYKCALPSSAANSKAPEENLYYIFNVNSNDGFVIVAGDDIVTPVWGYSNTGTYDPQHQPPAFQKWMENYKEQILYAKENNLEATNEIMTSWEELISSGGKTKTGKSLLTVNPLCNMTWDQEPYYNTACPYDAANTTNQHCVTGCPATAMAQIMKYWSYPAAGSGFHSYNHPTYGTLSANFGATTYNWAAMPNNVTSANSDVAALMFQCGVAVEMEYSPNSSGGYVIINSPTPTANSEYAYKTYFGYDPTTIQGLKRADYTTAAWKTLLNNELNSSRPVQYAGFGTGGGHTFVCDGYDANDFFHMNWGWSGFFDGYFDLDALNPGGTGTGGGTGGYNANQQAVIGIKPLTGGGLSAINMYSAITVNPNPIGFTQAFTVNADVINNGTGSFSGDYCAAIFTSTGDFIDYVQTLTASGSPLQAGYHYTGGLTFSSTGIFSVPGSYIIAIYYRNPGGNWNAAGNANYPNAISINISSPVDYIQQYSPIVATPTTFVQGQAASVNVNLVNDNTVTYYGQYEAALYDLSGNFVQTIGTYSETSGLPAGFDYLYPYITFSTTSITAPPGTYILAILELENGFSNWYLVGGDYYSTPVNIDVVASTLVPDSYEPNNTQATAYSLPLNWISNNAHPLTTGSNIHITTDYDFYKINLASGYNYTITARVHDSYNSGNGNTYTEDVLWSYNTGSSWSLAYDDVMPGNIIVNGAGTVTFQVAPYFIGTVGTYLLDININRVSALGVNDITDKDNQVQIFPNPATTYLTVRVSDNINLDKFNIKNLLGQVVIETLPTPSSTQIDISNLANGVYFLEAIGGTKSYSRKFIINR